MINPINLMVISLFSVLLSSCSSLGKGITEAILEKQQTEDTRICEVWGDGFTGLQPHLNHVKEGRMKVLMVHGVGDHQPGYSTEFFEKLARALNLSVTAKVVKNIQLADRENLDKPLGNLRINRYLNTEGTQELLFYELTWSEITAQEKAVLAYDNSGEYSFRRAKVNDLMKRFSNDTSPDPIIYLGEHRRDILLSFSQSFCWMTYGHWHDLPTKTKAVCTIPDNTTVNDDQYAFISHSLGSRITIDGLQRIATVLSDQRRFNHSDNKVNKLAIRQALKHKIIPIYMMSNQLPMLQLGRKLPEVSGQKSAYCNPNGEKYSQRLFARTPIIAFSDPNDLLSYALPPAFVNQYLDSRLCIDVTNVNINVAYVYDIFDLGKMANPIEAHVGYDTDDRVIALIAKGIGNPATTDLVKQRCRWIKMID